MSMKNLCLLVLFLTFQTNAAVFYNEWTYDFEKKLNVACFEQDGDFCHRLCGDFEDCQIDEPVCENCVANNLLMTKIFFDMGREYVNKYEFAYNDELLELLQSGEFVSLDSRSVYNLVTGHDSARVQEGFQSLCYNGVGYPLVLFSTKRNRIDKVKFVSCGVDTFHMSDEPNIDYENAKAKLY